MGGKHNCTIDLLFDLFGLACFAKKNVSCHTDDSKPVKQEVNGTVILPPLVFPALVLALASKLITKSNLYLIHYQELMEIFFQLGSLL
jgi:hypothetical protein